MTRVRSMGAFLYDFAVGDDPWIAALVVAAFAATVGLVTLGLNAWWLLPVVALAALTWSVRRAARLSR